MKVWTEYGSEHSMNLVMIGRFKDTQSAEKAKKLIDLLTERVQEEPDAYQSVEVPEGRRYSDRMLALMKETEIYNIGPDELEQLNYDARIRIKDCEIVVTTEEAAVSALLKLLLEHGARVEVYSAHDYPDTEQGRGR